MKKIYILLWIVLVTSSFAFNKIPPKQSQEACKNRPEGTKCSFMGPRGNELGTCAYTPNNKYYSCRPNRDNKQDNQYNKPNGKKRNNGEKYSIEQAISDNAQLHTISFAAMSFMSSNLCEMSFLPPGKHASYFGFQYLRDVIGANAGHEQNFVPHVANNLLYILTNKQKAILINLAQKQQAKIEKFALMRFPLLISFEKFSKNEFPYNKNKLDKNQIIKQSAHLYALDGELSFERAMGFAQVINSLSPKQTRYLDQFKTMSYNSWPKRKDQLDKREFNHEVHIALMTYASELFSWYIGDVTKDTYFTPERTASYFGSYWTKAAPMKAVKRDNYRISIKLTANSGAEFLRLLNQKQQSKITQLVQKQKPYLKQMVTLRESIAKNIREIYKGKTKNSDQIVSLSRRFGELDGQIAYLYANTFSSIKNNLSSSELKKAIKIRNISQYQCHGVFIYAEPSAVPNIGDISIFFN
mgnify:CR=1 FL=1